MFALELLIRLKKYEIKTAFIYQGECYSYDWLIKRVEYYQQLFCHQVHSGAVVQLVADYSPEAVAVFISLLLNHCIIAPLTNPVNYFTTETALLIHAECRIIISADQKVNWINLDNVHEESYGLYHILKKQCHAGLIILTSGSSGKPKAIVHDIEKLFSHIKGTASHITILSFLLFDHIGGINTLIGALYSGNTLIFSENRQPETIAQAMQQHHVNVLITSPSFLNLMCLKKCFDEKNFYELKQINYGSEVMPEVLLKKLRGLLPNTKLTQAYGMSELGVLPAKSENSESLKLRLDKNLIQYRIRDEQLEIKSNSSMLGYLNAPSPYTEDGWFKTGDRVQQDGEFLKILGRESDMINVGGEKVFPLEIEDILLKMPEIADVSICGEPHPLLGQRVVATIMLKEQFSREEFFVKMRLFCSQYLPAFKIPQKILIVETLDYGQRFKKMRQKKP